MKSPFRSLLCLAATLVLVVAGAQVGYGQNATTGTLTGVVMDAQKGVLPGATVVAVHTPTGTTYESITQGDGHFTILAVRVGGPYTIKASMTGFKTQEQTGVEVGLGESRSVEFTLPLESVTETVTVTAEAQVIDTARAGTAANVPSQVIETLPTISRSINDFARTSPFFSVGSAAAGNADAITVAGRNNRYNNMQIDGAVNNDVFGLADTGTPGGQTGTQPISLDAIQEIQLVVSPYDVRQGGFSGGGINAVTKSGSNSLHGSAFFYTRNQDFIGKIPGVVTPANPDPADTKVGEFSDKQMGFSIGGPILRNKAFFFGNADWGRKDTPVGYSADGSSGQQFSQQTYVQQVVNIAQNKYQYDTGGLGEFSKPNDSDKIFGRFDINLSPQHQLTLRTNYVNGKASIGTSSFSSYKMPSNFYYMTDKMISSVAQLNSQFGTLFNELRVTYSRERNKRGGQPGDPLFPEVRVYLPDGNSVLFGTEYSSQANRLNQDIVQVSDDVTWVKGAHTFSFGTQNEFYKFYNLFIQNLYGAYQFSSIANFEAGIAQSFNHNFSKTSNPEQAAEFSVRQLGFYAGDKWRMAPNFTLTYGARVDLPRFPDKPKSNPIPLATWGYGTDVVPTPTMFSPRAGFNWDISGQSGKRRQIRGGLGLFTGRTPYVWLSNQYGNTGMDFTALSVSYNVNNKVPFVADPNAQPVTVTGGSTGRQTINLIDPDYKYPYVLRTNIALDHDLGLFGLVGTAEFLYTKNLKEITYKNLNYIQGGSLPDGRPTFKKQDANLNDVVLLTNSNKGTSWLTSFKIERPFRNGFYFSASYLYGESKSVNDGTSSVARSNWAGVMTINPNDPALTLSNYSPGHRVNFAFTANVPLFGGLRSTASLFYNGQNGRPYSLGFNGSDPNGDGVSGNSANDLLYIPIGANDPIVTVTNGTWDQLMTYLNGIELTEGMGGKILSRNMGRAPWQNQMDFRYAVTIPTGGKTRAEVTLDVFNFLNLLNKDWGWQYWAEFPGMSRKIRYAGIDAATGKMRYDLSTITSSSFTGTFDRDDLKSRWQGQLGLRFRF